MPVYKLDALPLYKFLQAHNADLSAFVDYFIRSLVHITTECSQAVVNLINPSIPFIQTQLRLIVSSISSFACSYDIREIIEST